ncbi:epoxide hydrolase family protein [Micromonospora sp. NPDC050980]|uniref:epoxide hydrolase family protein n=1 Tax=Micromonospora sp. NPDC050980 TaxID=3155161 RepID=UPI0034026320
MALREFRPTVDPAAMEDLRTRLSMTRWPDQITNAGWTYGMDTDVLRAFVDRWRNGYDWTAEQARLQSVRHVLVDVDGFAVHVVHERSAHRGPAMPVVLLHGWPGSFVQFLPLIPLLTAPADPADAFDVVAMSLPGFGFGDRPTEPGMDVARIADLVGSVMTQLGYDRFAGRGSDLGAGVLQQLALRQPDRLVALHLSGTNPYLGDVPPDLSEAEQRFVAAAQQWNQAEMAYAMEHSSKPQTLAHALNDSPAGLASWILEKFHRWSDGGLAAYSRDELLTNLTVYWATGTIGSSMRLYYETVRSSHAAWGRVEVPTGMAMSDRDMFPTPREWVERSYRVVHWTDLPRGGHFLEWEAPDLIAEDMRGFFRSYR